MPTIPEAPHKGVLPEEHARPPCRGCVLEDRRTERDRNRLAYGLTIAWVTSSGRLSTAGVSSDRRVMTSLYLHVMRENTAAITSRGPDIRMQSVAHSSGPSATC
jgi:hypothetical protein